MDGKSGLSQQIESFRDVRREMEEAVLPLATSVDGRRFTFQASLHRLDLQAGGYVMLEGRGTPRLGQVLSLELHWQLAAELTLPPADGSPVARTEVPIRYARGEGLIVDGGTAPFHDALIRVAAESDQVAVYSADAPGGRRLRLHAAEIDPATQAAALRLDPIADREECRAGRLARQREPSHHGGTDPKRASRGQAPRPAYPQPGRGSLLGARDVGLSTEFSCRAG